MYKSLTKMGVKEGDTVIVGEVSEYSALYLSAMVSCRSILCVPHCNT